MTLRDALSLSQKSENLAKTLKSFNLHQVAKVPITASIFDVFMDMKKHGWHFAVVIDEYGGTAGIVTFEDILEDLV
jgi:putative hemolysin